MEEGWNAQNQQRFEALTRQAEAQAQQLSRYQAAAAPFEDVKEPPAPFPWDSRPPARGHTLRYTRKPGTRGRPLPGSRTPCASEPAFPGHGRPPFSLPGFGTPGPPGGSPGSPKTLPPREPPQGEASPQESERALLMLIICLLTREKADRELIWALIYILIS